MDTKLRITNHPPTYQNTKIGRLLDIEYIPDLQIGQTVYNGKESEYDMNTYVITRIYENSAVVGGLLFVINPMNNTCFCNKRACEHTERFLTGRWLIPLNAVPGI